MEGSKSLQKALSVLMMFTPAHPTRTAPELTELAGMHKTSMYRMLSTLCDERFLERDDSTGVYSVGRSAYRLGSLYLSTNSLLIAAEPVVKLVNELTLEATSLGIFENGFVTLVMREEPKHDFRWGRHVGSSFPAHTSSMGKALLSDFSNEEIDVLYNDENLERPTLKSLRTKAALKAELAEVRRTGVSFDYEGTVEWVIGVGSVVRNYDGKIMAGLSIAMPKFRYDGHSRDRYAGLVKRAAALVSYRLGYSSQGLDVFDLPMLRESWNAAQRPHLSDVTQSQQLPPTSTPPPTGG